MKYMLNDHPNDIASKLIGKRCIADWPYGTEATIVGASTSSHYFFFSSRGKVVASETPANSIPWADLVAKLKQQAITNQGIDFEQSIPLVLHLNMFEGMKRVRGSGMKKKFSSTVTQVPVQLVTTNEGMIEKMQRDSRFKETMINLTIDQEFPPGAKIAYLHDRGVAYLKLHRTTTFRTCWDGRWEKQEK